MKCLLSSKRYNLRPTSNPHSTKGTLRNRPIPMPNKKLLLQLRLKNVPKHLRQRLLLPQLNQKLQLNQLSSQAMKKPAQLQDRLLLLQQDQEINKQMQDCLKLKLRLKLLQINRWPSRNKSKRLNSNRSWSRLLSKRRRTKMPELRRSSQLP